MATDSNGKFIINPNINLENLIYKDLEGLKEENKDNLEPLPSINEVKIEKEGYKERIIPTKKGDGTYKEDLGIIKLIPTQQQVKLDKLKASQLSVPEIEFISLDKKDFKYYIQDQLNTQWINLKKTLIPLVISLISEFGISTATEMLGEKLDDLKSCPDPVKLKKIIKSKNKLVKTLNNILKIIETTLITAGITQGVIVTFDVALKILKNTPIPPPIDPTGVITQQLNNTRPKLEVILETSKKLNSSILTILVVLRQNLIVALDLLKMLDNLIQDCYPEAEQAELAFELLKLTEEEATQLNPVITNVNGFEMGVEIEKTNKPLKRVRAIARNKQGIVMLKGEWSFSSVNQILIDELVFYIQTNDLKAD
tara:strand:- start:6639 stop:7742 length:1104 start_codon:yes stop_codon:yes gene_type:complete